MRVGLWGFGGEGSVVRLTAMGFRERRKLDNENLDEQAGSFLCVHVALVCSAEYEFHCRLRQQHISQHP